MNLGQIKQKVRMLGRNYFGTDADRDPFALDYLIFEQANQIALQTDCLVGTRYADILAGVTQYCSPDIYKIRSVKLLTANGDYTQPRMYDFADQMLTPLRNASAQFWPDVVATRGMNQIAVYPAASADIINGIRLEGYCVPGDYWQYDTTGTAVPNTDLTECPLPVTAHDCLVYAVLYARAVQFQDPNGLALFKNEYENRLGILESNSATYVRRTV